MRCATVASGTRKARATSSVVRPPSSRRVSATRASVESTGWHVVNTSRRRSSSNGSSAAAARSGCSTPPPRRSSSCPSSRVLRSWTSARRRRSTARCFAVAMSQAPGLSGTPDSGHCSSAATSASCARSSARPTSRTIRARPAISRADSIRQTASIVRLTSGDATAAPGLRARLGLLPQPRLALAELGRELLAEVLGLEHGPELDLAVGRAFGTGNALDPLDRLVERLHLPHPVAGHELLRLRERAVDHRALVAREADPRALRARVQALAGQHHAGLDELLVEGRHLGQELLARHLARLALLVGLDQDHDS